MVTLTAIELRHPEIPWREPIKVTFLPHGAGFACRLCIAAAGLRHGEFDRLWATAEEVRVHLEQQH